MPGGGPGYEEVMPAFLLLFVPGTVALLATVLFVSALAEERFLSPGSVILGTVRARNNTPEYVEAFVARQSERLLRGQRAH